MCPILALGVDGGTVALDDSVLPVLVCHSDRVGGAAVTSTRVQVYYKLTY